MPRPIRFEFVGYGHLAEDDLAGHDRVYLDVGNDLRVGVLDHHQFSLFQGSATRLVCQRPELVLGALSPSDAPVTLIVHRSPDLDAVSAAFLARHVVMTGELPSGALALADYVDRVDRGALGASLQNPFALYSAYMQIVHGVGQKYGSPCADAWAKMLTDGLRVVEYVSAQAVQANAPLLEVDAFRCPGLFRRRDRDEIKEDRERYRRKLSDPASHALSLRLTLPDPAGGGREVDALLVRNVQGLEDDDRVAFFKDWARSDTETSPSKRGFVALSVIDEGAGASSREAILSVVPDAGVSLLGLGARLEEAERQARVCAFGRDDRDTDPETGRVLPPRPGYDSPDPWYDGRGHDHTIVASPRAGTLLDADALEGLLRGYGGGGTQSFPPLPLADRSDVLVVEPDEREHPERYRERMRQRVVTLDAQVRRRRGSAPPSTARRARVFVSYAHAHADWVREQVYAPLARRFGAEDVFLDKVSLVAGTDWLVELADQAERCRVFVPVFSPEYLASPFCQWELEAARPRHGAPDGLWIAPVLTGHPRLPAEMARLHGLDATLDGWCERLLACVALKLEA